VKRKIILRVIHKDPKNGAEHVRCTVKQSAEAGTIRIEGGIDWWANNSAQFRAAIDALKSAGVKTLDVYLNSPGGSVYEANEIANILDSWTGEKTLTLGALCCSAATNLILPFEKKNVKAYSNITAMMHNPTISIFDAEEKDLVSNAKLLANTKKTYIKKMSVRTGLSETQLSNKLDQTWWMTYQDLVDNNLVGGKVEKEDALPADTANVFNACKYENVPVMLNKALGVELLNEDEDLDTDDGKSDSGNKTLLKTTMKNLLSLLMVSVLALKNKLTETATEAEVVAAITNAFNEKETEITTLKQSLKDEQEKVKTLNTQVENHNTQMITALLDVAEKTEKKITPDQRKVFNEQAKTLGFDGLQKIINAIPARTSIKNALENGGEGKGKKAENQTEDRVDPEFVETADGRLYNKAGNQRDALQRAIVAQQAAAKVQ
jgi:ATP-dependent Clp protease protease subunit